MTRKKVMTTLLNLVEDALKIGKLKNESLHTRIGFGTFVDIPYHSLIYTTGNLKSMEPYLFKNDASLSDDTDSILAKFNITEQFSIDAPEAMFDALLQVSECQKQIGWSDPETFKRIVVVVSEREVKFAGHGNMLGLLMPNDGKCKLKDNTTMEHPTQDYVHPSQVGESLTKNSIKVLFLVGHNQKRNYEILTQFFTSQVIDIVEFFEIDPSTIQNRIILAAQTKLQDYRVNIQNLPPNSELKISSDCGGKDFKDINTCLKVDNNQEVNFKISIKLQSCLTEDINSKISINDHFFIPITLKKNCECSCQKPENFIKNHEGCSENGDLVCGKCLCKDKTFGSNCNCTEEMNKNKDKCKNEKNEICSGKGECICGKCYCYNDNEKSYGELCEYSRFTCPIFKDQMCNGRGRCEKNKCICNEMYTGEDCSELDCKYNISDSCRNPNNNKVCSDHGNCVCHKCKCHTGYSGLFCDILEDPTINCKDLEICAKNDFKQSKSKIGCNFTVERVTKFNHSNTVHSPHCVLFYDDCFIYFSPIINPNSTVSKVFKKISTPKDCKKKVEVWLIVSLTVAVTLVISFFSILGLYAIYYHLYETSVYKKHMHELNKAVFMEIENPLYDRI